MRWLVAGLAVPLVLAGCGGSERAARPDDTRTVRGGGLTAEIPRDWHTTVKPVNGVVSPLQRLLVTSFELERPFRNPDCSLRSLHRQLPEDGAFVYLFEYEGPTARQLSDMPPRPERFRLDPATLAPYECAGRGYMVRFRDRRRSFQAHITLGPDASRRTRERILAVLDSIEVERPGPRNAAVWAPPDGLFRRAPYMGVSCPRPNRFACDRVGLQVVLRRPAVAVSAEIGGRRFALDQPRERDGGRTFTGFLQPAGLLEPGPLRLRADDGRGRWVGRKSKEAAVEVVVERAAGRVQRTSLVVPLAAGWG